MLTLSKNPQETLTNNLWETWSKNGYTKLPGALTWVDVNNLSGHYLKLCNDKQEDYRAYDFQNLIDHTLNYYENKSALDEAIGQTKTAEQYKVYEATEKAAEQNQKATTIYNDLADLPNFDNKVKALSKSQNFKDIAAILSIIKPAQANNPNDKVPSFDIPHGQGPEYCSNCGVKLEANVKECWNCHKPTTQTITEQKQPAAIKQTKPKATPYLINKIKTATTKDFLGVMVLIIWLAITYTMLTTWTIDAIAIAEMAIFWICFVPAYKLIRGEL